MSMDLAKKTFSTQPDYLICQDGEIITAAKRRQPRERRSRGAGQLRQAGRQTVSGSTGQL